MKFRVPQLTKNKIDEFFKKYADIGPIKKPLL